MTVPAPSFDNELGGRAADNARENMSGRRGERDLFKIDSTPGTFNRTDGRSVDLISGFLRSDGDMLRFGADSTAMDSVDTELFVRLEDLAQSTGSKDSLFIYKTQGDVGSLIAVMGRVGTDFELTNADVWENATVTDFAIDRTDGSAAGRQTLEGGSGKQTFKVDVTGSNLAGADVIKNFSKTDGDVIEIAGYNAEVFVQNNKDVTGDGTIDTVIVDFNRRSDSVLVILEDFTANLDNDDFVTNITFVLPNQEIV